MEIGKLYRHTIMGTIVRVTEYPLNYLAVGLDPNFFRGKIIAGYSISPQGSIASFYIVKSEWEQL